MSGPRNEETGLNTNKYNFEGSQCPAVLSVECLKVFSFCDFVCAALNTYRLLLLCALIERAEAVVLKDLHGTFVSEQAVEQLEMMEMSEVPSSPSCPSWLPFER